MGLHFSAFTPKCQLDDEKHKLIQTENRNLFVNDANYRKTPLPQIKMQRFRKQSVYLYVRLFYVKMVVL